MRVMILFVLLYSFNINSQDIYEFDRLLTYKYSNSNDSLNIETHLYLTNSNDNNYFAMLSEKDSLTYAFYFRDNEKLTLMTEIDKADFYKAQSITTNCNGVTSWSNKNLEKQIKKLEIYRFNDTLIDSKNYQNYRIRDKKKNLKKLGYRYLVLNDSVHDALPLIANPYDYELWKSKGFPNGLIVSFGYVNEKKNTSFGSLLDSIYKVNKKLIIPKKCIGNYINSLKMTN